MSRLLNLAQRLRQRAVQLRSESQGNVSMLLGLSLIPIVGIVGLGCDYGIAITDKAKLDNAADTAAIAAVATAKAYVAANATQPNVTTNAIAAGITQATNTFNVNAGTVPYAQYQLQTPVLTRSGQTFTSSISYSATVRNNFGQLFNQPTFNMANTSKATADIPSYLDFYLLVDVSGSMGIPTTAAGMQQLQQNNQDMFSDYKQGCQFACHMPNTPPYTAWTYAVTNHVQLRSDAVNSAICSLLQRASSPLVPNQYRVGIYPFINQMATLSAITSNMSVPSAAAQCGSPWPAGMMTLTNLLDNGTTQLMTNNDTSTGTGSGGTHFEKVFPQMYNTISPYGDGSTQSASRPFVFLVTDGMENGQHYGYSNGRYNVAGVGFDGSSPSQIDPSLCASLKQAGATISVLYIPYNQLSFTNLGGYVSWENGQVNGFSPTLATPLQACASPGFFYTANSPADITSALNAMFNKALQVAHLVQ